MKTETITLLTVLVPILGSLTIPLAGLVSRAFRSAWSVLLGAVTVVLPMTLIPFALGGGEIVSRYPFVLGLDLVLVTDPLAVHNLPQERLGHLDISPLQFQAAGLLLSDKALLIRFYRHRHGAAGHAAFDPQAVVKVR